MKIELVNQIRDALVCVGRVAMTRYETDLLYDFVGVMKAIEQNKEYTIFVTNSSTHSKDAYLTRDEVINDEEVGIYALIERAKRTSGIDFSLGLRKSSNGLEATIINVNLDKSLLSYLVDNLTHHDISVRKL